METVQVLFSAATILMLWIRDGELVIEENALSGEKSLHIQSAANGLRPVCYSLQKSFPVLIC